jgi:predicted RNA methylase
MSVSPDAGPFHPDRVGDLSWLCGRLRAAGFAEGNVSRVVEGRGERMLDVACALHRTAEASPFHSLMRLFVLGVELSDTAACDALTPAGVEALVEAGVLDRSGSAVRAIPRLVPWRDFFLLSDRLPIEGNPFPHDYVMSGTSASSLLLSRLTPKRKVGTALDVGAGAGIHALLAARHAGQVIATDTNPRALNFAQMNARLNGIENISFRQGSFFEPVRGERFDLIVSNPPFLISPTADLMFQNPGAEADSVSELMIRQAPEHLSDPGQAVSLISWCHRTDDDWAERPVSWADACGADFWLLRATSEDPISYAAHALRQTESIHGAHYAERLDEWTTYYREAGIARLALGAACLRRRSARNNWVHCEDLSGAALTTDASEQLERIFATEDLLSDLAGDEQLLDLRLALHPDHVLEQELVAGDDGWISRSIVLKSRRGIERRAALDAQVLFLLTNCNGSQTTRALIAAVAERDGADFSTTAQSGLPLVRRLLRAGFLVAAENPPIAASRPPNRQDE